MQALRILLRLWILSGKNSPPDPLKQACLSLVQDDPLPPDGVSLSSHVHVSSKKGLAPILRPQVAASLALGTATNVPSSSRGITAFNYEFVLPTARRVMGTDGGDREEDRHESQDCPAIWMMRGLHARSNTMLMLIMMMVGG
jgi:hypothetical protein